MNILDDLLSVLNFDAAVQDIRQGIFHTGVLTRYCGLAATLPRDALRQEPPMVREPGLLLDKSARELADMAYSGRILEAAIGMATINSLIELDESRCVELNASDLILEKGTDKRVAIVGHFPFIPRVREYCREIWVIEKNPREGDVTEAEAEHVIPRADVVAITGTSITNHTLGHILGLCRSGSYIIMLGDSVLLSDVLFDYGIDALCGTRVVDSDLALKCVGQGANFRQIMGVKRVTLRKARP
ncbi:MAG TPA: DUF364 domain-containing protein [Spirochaetota bacterium]|nr:DUF364 domain-containing protein [Spirochaetota bacterium]HPV41131.1 DUF364 domain-containing protein [Spirochaetota bacterium]